MSKITSKMQQAIDFARQHSNKLFRHSGGYWAGPDFKQHGVYFGTNTVHGLVTRGIAEYTDWKESNGRFPVEMTLIHQQTR